MQLDHLVVNVDRMVRRTDIDSAVALAVMSRMADRNVTTPEVAQTLGISEKALTQRFVGTTSFRLQELQSIADVLDCVVADLVPSTRVSRGVA